MDRGHCSILATGTPPGDWTTRRSCLHPQHNPPMHIALLAGESLHHKCPGCKYEWTITGQPIYV